MSGLPALNQRQTWPGGISHRSKPAAAMNQLQDRSAMCRARLFGFATNHNTTGRGFGPGTLNSHPTTKLGHIPPLFEQRAILLPARGGQLPVRAVIAAPGLSIRATRFQPDPAQSLPRQQVLQTVADRHTHRRRLSCSSSSDGFKTIGKAFADGQNLFARGSKND